MDNYEDIINMPHHVSDKHPRMSMYQRASQFAPFAALGKDSVKGKDDDSFLEEDNDDVL